MKYNSKYTGQYYQLQGGEVYVLRADGRFAYAGAETSQTIMVQLTGYYYADEDMYQTTSGGWIRMRDGWQNTGYSPIRLYSQKDAQYYVNKIIKANTTILENNLFCARFANKLSDEQQFRLYGLQTRLENRNSQLLNDGFCIDQQVATPPGYSLLANNLSTFMQAYASGASIGAVISTSTIVVVAVVVASLATAAYFAYKYIASEAEQDVKYSEELTKALMAKLTPEEYSQLMNETKGIVTKSKLTAKFGGAMSVLKWGLLAAAGLVMYKFLKSNNYESKN